MYSTWLSPMPEFDFQFGFQSNCLLVILQVKNISIEILDFYDTYKIDPQKGLLDEKINPIMNKLPSKA